MRDSMPKRMVLISGLTLAAIVFLIYYPGLRMGFYLDDYNYLERAGRTDWSNALVQIFDPRVQILWYRPLQALQFFLEFQIFGGNANAYHVVNMGFHAVNVLLLYALVWRISRKWLLGFASALFYVSFPVYASGINWIGIVDPLTAIFYLLSIWFWWTYLEKEDRVHYVLAFGSFVLTLMSKQIGITIPIVLFLVEWWLMGKPVSIPRAVRRYGLFVAGALIFSLVQYATQSTHTFAGVFGWQVGATMVFILVQYLVLFFFPYGVFPSLDINQVEAGDAYRYIWLIVALVVLLYVMWRKRSAVLLFLAVFTLLNLFPVLPFPFIEHRYLYIPILSAAILLGLMFDLAKSVLGRQPWFALASSGGLALLFLGSGLALNESALSAAEWARQLRVPFRDIERQHATFPKDTLLYFIDPITPTTGGLGGMFFLRYGRDITVKNWTEYAGLRDHNVSYVYYFDEARRPREILADKDAAPLVSPSLPLDFAVPIRLEGFEVAGTNIPRGSPVVLILYWRALDKIDRSYTVFVHLLDRDGRLVAGYDSQPRKGQDPTTAWERGVLNAEAILMPVGSAVPLGGGYRMAAGLYDAQTQQRLAVVDAQGHPAADMITIEPFTVVEQGTDATRR